MSPRRLQQLPLNSDLDWRAHGPLNGQHERLAGQDLRAWLQGQGGRSIRPFHATDSWRQVPLTPVCPVLQVRTARVLAVGAGGIGCELLKTLVLTGFEDINVVSSGASQSCAALSCTVCAHAEPARQVDLDTIEVSNLNRQFLFRRSHVGHSKASTAALAVQTFRPRAKITAHQVGVLCGSASCFSCVSDQQRLGSVVLLKLQLVLLTA